MTVKAHIVYPYGSGQVLYEGPEGVLVTLPHPDLSFGTPVQTGDYEEPIELRDSIGRRLGRYVRVAIVLEPELVQPDCYKKQYLDQFDVVFSFSSWQQRNVIPFRHRLPMLWPALPQTMNTRPWAERKNTIIAVCSNKYTNRYLDLLDLASVAASEEIGLDVYGNIPFPEPWYRGPLEIGMKIARMSEYRYAYCTENHPTSLYVSEKLPEAIAAGCVPLYYSERSGTKQERTYPLIPWKLVKPAYAEHGVSISHPSKSNDTMSLLHTWGRTDAYRAMCDDMTFDHIARLILRTVGVDT